MRTFLATFTNSLFTACSMVSAATVMVTRRPRPSVVSTETCILLPQKITVLGQLQKPFSKKRSSRSTDMKMASENREVGVNINLFPVVVRSIPNTFRKYKTRHYSGIGFMSREQRENCSRQRAMAHKNEKNGSKTTARRARTKRSSR